MKGYERPLEVLGYDIIVICLLAWIRKLDLIDESDKITSLFHKIGLSLHEGIFYIG